jgi:hypothetical protein
MPPVRFFTPRLTSLVRLEPACTSASLTEGLAARVADPLWLLGRQWQFGELTAEDAGSPVRVVFDVESAPLTAMSSGELRAPVSGERPLEPCVEAVDVLAANAPGRDRLSADLGALARHALSAAQWSLLRTLPGLRRSRDALIDGVALIDLFDRGVLPEELLTALADWREMAREYASPWTEDAPWRPERLEHRVRLEAGGLLMEAPAYPGGRLDWSAFDIERAADAAGQIVEYDAIPTPLRFHGSPANRWWVIEDEGVSLSDLEACEEDLVRTLLAEVVTSFGEDWYLLPVPLRMGAVSRVRAVRVHDVFAYGSPTSVDAFAQTDAERHFRVFELTGQRRPTGGAGPWLLLTPASDDVLEGPAVEEVLLHRDEVANLGWAVERLVEGPDGEPVARAGRWGGAAAARGDAGWGWRHQTPAPTGWVPLVPEADGSAHFALRRGRLPPPFEGALARFLCPGRPWRIPERLVPPSGARLTRRWQRTRGADGAVCLWSGRERQLGGGDEAPDLSFDELLR